MRSHAKISLLLCTIRRNCEFFPGFVLDLEGNFGNIHRHQTDDENLRELLDSQAVFCPTRPLRTIEQEHFKFINPWKPIKFTKSLYTSLKNLNISTKLPVEVFQGTFRMHLCLFRKWQYCSNYRSLCPEKVTASPV